MASLTLSLENIPRMDVRGWCDPYVIIIQDGVQIKKLDYMEDTSTADFHGINLGYPNPSAILKFEIWDYDRYTADDFIGVLEIKYSDLLKSLSKDTKFYLQDIGGKFLADKKLTKPKLMSPEVVAEPCVLSFQANNLFNNLNFNVSIKLSDVKSFDKLKLLKSDSDIFYKAEIEIEGKTILINNSSKVTKKEIYTAKNANFRAFNISNANREMTKLSGKSKLKISIFDKDTFSSDFIFEFNILLGELLVNKLKTIRMTNKEDKFVGNMTLEVEQNRDQSSEKGSRYEDEYDQQKFQDTDIPIKEEAIEILQKCLGTFEQVKCSRGGFFCKVKQGSDKKFKFLKNTSLQLVSIQVLENCLLIRKPDPNQAGTVLWVQLFDRYFKREAVLNAVTREGNLLKILNAHRELSLTFSDEKQAESCEKLINKQWKAHKLKDQEVPSFAPIRKNNNLAKWFIQGRDYYWYLSELLEKAEQEIYISAWWLIPEIHLRRPVEEHPTYSFKAMLEKKAKAGVKIYILLFGTWATEATLRNGAKRIEKLLNPLPNVQVMKFGSSMSNLCLYSNHDKFVCIDQCVAFVGGIDIAYDRWDDDRYLLYDQKISELEKFYKKDSQAMKEIQQLHPNKDKMTHGGSSELWPGKDYNHITQFILGFEDWFKTKLNRNKDHRSPWQDVHSLIIGESAYDVATHFIQRWNMTKVRTDSSDIKEDNYSSIKMLIPARLSEIQDRADKFINMSQGKDKMHKISLEPSRESFDRNFTKVETQVTRSFGPWSAGTLKTERSVEQAYILAISQAEKYVYIENQYFITTFKADWADTRAQKSSSTQSRAAHAQPEVKNLVGQAILQKVYDMHQKKQPFKVYIVLPLMPDTGSDIFDFKKDIQMKGIMHYNYSTLIKDNPKVAVSTSLFKALESKGIDYRDYFHVAALRKYEQLTDKIIPSEQIYVHSKVLLVDDKVSIIGSANLNDRSLEGARDSEVCVTYFDFKSSTQNFTGSLRCKLWSNFLGKEVKVIENMDPSLDSTFNEWKRIARNNSLIYDKVYKFAPNNMITDYKTLSKCKKSQKKEMLLNADVKQAHVELKKIEGVLTDWPLLFLEKEWFHPASIPGLGQIYNVMSRKFGPVT